MINKQLFLYQLCDSSFPTGSFSHSYGFETYMEAGRINDIKGFMQWLDCYLQQQLCYTDGLAIRIAYQAFECNDFARICQLSKQLKAQCLAKEIRLANQKMGKQFLMLGQALVAHENIDRYQKLVREKKIEVHPSVIFALLTDAVGISLEDSIEAFLMNMVTTLIQNAVRGVPLGQTAAQKMLLTYHEKIPEVVGKIKELSEDTFGAASPGLEINQMKHENLFARNFMS